MISFSDLDVTFEPRDITGSSESGHMQNMAKALFDKTQRIDGVSSGITTCYITRANEGRSNATTFQVRFCDSNKKVVTASFIKMYQADPDQPRYSEELRRLQACKERLKKAVFSLDFTALGRQGEFLGIAYPDAQFETGRPTLTLSQWLEKAATQNELQWKNGLAALKTNLIQAFGALNGIETGNLFQFREEFQFFRRTWLPHFYFTSNTKMFDERLKVLSVDGIGPGDSTTVLTTGEKLRQEAVSDEKRDRSPLRSPVMELTTQSSDLLTLKASRVTVHVKTTGNLAQNRFSKGDSFSIVWRRNGDQTKTYAQLHNDIWNNIPADQKLSSSRNTPKSDDAIQNMLNQHMFRRGGIHGDLHAGNILVNSEGNLDTVRLIDFSDLSGGPRYYDAARLEASIWYNLSAHLHLSPAQYREIWLSLQDSSKTEPTSNHGKLLYWVCRTVREAAEEGILNWSRTEYLTTLSLIAPTMVKWAWRWYAEPSNPTIEGPAKAIYSLFDGANAWLEELANHQVEEESPSPLDDPDSTPENETGLEDQTGMLGALPFLRETASYLPPTYSREEAPATAPGTLGSLWEKALSIALDRPNNANATELSSFFWQSHANLAGCQLLDLQQQAFHRPEDLFRPQNHVVFSGPTSSGKTFLADLAMLKEAFVTKRFCIYVSPTRVLAQDRIRKLRTYIPEHMRNRIILSTGEDTEDDHALYQADFAIACTVYEKANILFTHGPFDMSQLGLLVVDEVHMMEDLHRGSIVELLIMKVKEVRHQVRQDIRMGHPQTVPLPRTLIISSERTVEQRLFINWLQDENEDSESVKSFHVSRRPIPMDQFLIIPGNDGQQASLVKITTVESQNDLVISDAKYLEIEQLVAEKRRANGLHKSYAKRRGAQKSSQAISRKITLSFLNKYVDETSPGKRVLVFGPSKTFLIGLARKMAEHPLVSAQNMPIPESIDNALAKAEPSRLTQKQKLLAKHGIFMHNANVDKGVRQGIEEHFGTVEQSRFIEFLFATSTLSYGVNLSVDCVVLTMLNFPITNRFGDIETKQLSVHEFHNMLGRTGRYGLSNRGIGIIVGDMVQIDPMDDIISHYYRKPNQPATELLSALVVPHDQRLADKRASIKKGGMFSNPFIRTVLDVLRHAEQKNGNTARPVSIDEVTSFLEKSYHSQMNGGGVTQVQLRNSISSIFEFCTEKDIKIITSTPSRHTDGEMLYGTNALTNAIIDTGTEITTLEPLLRWNGFLTENVRREGNPMHNNWVPELHFIGLLLSPEAWRIGWEFAPEHREDFPSDEHVVALNRMKVMEEAAAELKQLGLNRPTDVLNIIVKHIREQFSDLGVKLPYENAHVEIVLRLFTALCRWVSGQPLPKIEASSRANVGGSNLDGRSERITNLNQRMSWLAVAMYRCVVFKEGQVSIDNNEGPSPDSLLRLSQRLRTGCPSDALPLFGRKRSQLGRHHATALIEAGFNVDTLLSHQPDLAISLIHETLENKGLHLKDGTGADLLSDLIDLTLVDDKNLAFRMERHHEEGPRLDLRDAWQKVNQRRSELFATTQHIDATKEAIIQHMKRASELLLTLESSVVEAGHQTRLTLSVNGSFELPVAPPNAFTFNFCFTRPMARIVDVGTNRKFTHLCLPPAELMNQVGAIPVSNVTFVVGIPWFLPNAMNELHIKLTTNDPNRRWILISISGYFSLLTLLIRGFIALDSFREGLDTFQKGVNTLRVSHIPHHFATRGLLADIREAMEEHREVVLQRRERTAVQ